MHSINYYTRSPPDVQDSRIEEFIAVSKVLENLDKPDKTVSTMLRIALKNQYGEQNCVTVDKAVWKEEQNCVTVDKSVEKKSRTVSLWINQSEKKSRTMSQWINQSENVPCQRVRKRDKPAKQEKQKKNRVNVYRKT